MGLELFGYPKYDKDGKGIIVKFHSKLYFPYKYAFVRNKDNKLYKCYYIFSKQLNKKYQLKILINQVVIFLYD